MFSLSGSIDKILSTWTRHLKAAKETASDAVIHGFKWAGILIAITTIPLATASIFFANQNDATYNLGHSSQIGVAIASLAAGAKVHWIESVSGLNLGISASGKLTLLTVLVQLVALRRGRKLGRTSRDLLYIPISLTALGFASTIFVATYLIHGFDGLVNAPQASDFLRLFLCVAIPMALGAILRKYSETESVVGLRDSLKSIRIYALLLSAAALLALGIFWLVETIRPDFIYSQSTGFTSTKHLFSSYLIGAILAFALNLPAVVIGTLSVLSGVSLAASVSSTIEIPSFLSGLINNICEISKLGCVATSHSFSTSAGLLTLVNDYSQAKRATYVAIFLFVIGLLMALSSSFSASSYVSEQPLRRRVFGSLISYSLVAGYFVWLVNAEFSMSEQPTSKIQTNLDHGTGSIGLATGSLFAVAAIFAFMNGVSTTGRAKSGLVSAFPRIARVFHVETSVTQEGQTAWKAFGKITSTVMFATLFISLIGATYERVYAIKHGPAFFAAKVQSVLEAGDIEGFMNLTDDGKVNSVPETPNRGGSELYDACPPKPYYCFKYRKVHQKVRVVTHGNWLNRDVMVRALPKSSVPAGLSIENSNNKPHKTGQLDATITYLIGAKNSRVKYPLALTGSTHSLFHVDLYKGADADYLTAAKYKYHAQPVKLSISKGKYYPKSLLKKLTINGKRSRLGTFKTVPGTYRVKLPGYKMILPTDVVLHTDGLAESVQVGATAKVPAELSTQMDKRYRKYRASACKMKFTKQQIQSTCWSDMDIWSERELISGKKLDFFENFQITKAKADPIKCVKQQTALTSASSVKTHYVCTSAITQTVRMSVEARYAQGDPIYSEVPTYRSEQYDACPWAEYYCWRVRQIQTGTETKLVGYKRGPLISPAQSVTGIFKSVMTKDLYIRGTMTNNGKYAVKIG